ISVVEDTAQAFGSTMQGLQAGSLGRYGAFSFYPTKNIGAFGDAGGIFARTEEDAAHLRMLRNYGQKDRYTALIPRGINSRLDEVQAAILSFRLKRFE